MLLSFLFIACSRHVPDAGQVATAVSPPARDAVLPCHCKRVALCGALLSFCVLCGGF
jgi:hypothetical protein